MYIVYIIRLYLTYTLNIPHQAKIRTYRFDYFQYIKHVYMFI